jgi:hypothetical protein
MNFDDCLGAFSAPLHPGTTSRMIFCFIIQLVLDRTISFLCPIANKQSLIDNRLASLLTGVPWQINKFIQLF